MPLEIALLFQTASLNTIEVVVPVESGGGSSEPEHTIPAVDDKYLSTIDNFEVKFWSSDKFIEQFRPLADKFIQQFRRTATGR